MTWTAQSPYEPHTITFGQLPFTDTDGPATLVPGNDYTGGVANSGFIGPNPVFPSSTYALRFTTLGTYHYICILHPGMEGEVTVT